VARRARDDIRVSTARFRDFFDVFVFD